MWIMKQNPEIYFFLMFSVFCLFVSRSRDNTIACSNTIFHDKRCAKIRDENQGAVAKCDALPPPTCDDIVFIKGSPFSNAICDTFLPPPKMARSTYEKKCVD